MKKWIPVTISVCLHLVIFYLIASNSIPTPYSEQQSQAKPIEVILYFPPIKPAVDPPAVEFVPTTKGSHIQTPNNPEEQLKNLPDGIEPLQKAGRNTENNAKENTVKGDALPIVKRQPIEEPNPKINKAELSNTSTENNNIKQSVKQTTSPISTQNIQQATRQALKNLHSHSLQDLIEVKQKQDKEKDSRIIVDAPRKSLEQIYEEQQNAPPPVEVDCTNISKKVLAITTGALGGRVKCRSQSSEQINQFINKHINKTQVKAQSFNENDQPK